MFVKKNDLWFLWLKILLIVIEHRNYLEKIVRNSGNHAHDCKNRESYKERDEAIRETLYDRCIISFALLLLSETFDWSNADTYLPNGYAEIANCIKATEHDLVHRWRVRTAARYRALGCERIAAVAETLGRIRWTTILTKPRRHCGRKRRHFCIASPLPSGILLFT